MPDCTDRASCRAPPEGRGHRVCEALYRLVPHGVTERGAGHRHVRRGFRSAEPQFGVFSLTETGFSGISIPALPSARMKGILPPIYGRDSARTAWP
jgi:hypothetical protein